MGDVDHGLDLDRPYKELGDPLDMNDARKAAHVAAKMRREAEKELRQRIDTCAENEGAYRQLLARQIVKQKAEHGATVAKELAHDDSEVKQALIDYKIADGMVAATQQRLRGLEGERSMLKSLIDWSSSIANVLRQTAGESENRQHEADRPIGARR